MIRGIGWFLIEFIKMFVDSAESLLNEVYKLIGFNQFATIDKFMSKAEFRILFTVIFAISILYLGYCFLIKSEKPRGVMENILVSICVICSLSFFMVQLNNLTIASISFLKPTQQNTSGETIKSAITDVLYVDKNGFNGIRGNMIPTEKIGYINPTEVISNSSPIINRDILLKDISTDEYGNLSLYSIESNILGFDTSSYYYRYYIDFFSIFISLIAVALVLFVSAYKTTKLIFELVINQILAIFFSTNVVDSKKLKMILNNIFSSYVVIILCVIMIKLFLMGQEFILSNITNVFARSLILIFFALATIDGPNIVERIFGIDVGLSSGFRSIMSVWALSKVGAGITKGAITAGGLGASIIGDSAKGVSNKINSLGKQTAENGGIKNGGLNKVFNDKTKRTVGGMKDRFTGKKDNVKGKLDRVFNGNSGINGTENKDGKLDNKDTLNNNEPNTKDNKDNINNSETNTKDNKLDNIQNENSDNSNKGNTLDNNGNIKNSAIKTEDKKQNNIQDTAGSTPKNKSSGINATNENNLNSVNNTQSPINSVDKGSLNNKSMNSSVSDKGNSTNNKNIYNKSTNNLKNINDINGIGGLDSKDINKK